MIALSIVILDCFVAYAPRNDEAVRFRDRSNDERKLSNPCNDGANTPAEAAQKRGPGPERDIT